MFLNRTFNNNYSMNIGFVGLVLQLSIDQLNSLGFGKSVSIFSKEPLNLIIILFIDLIIVAVSDDWHPEIRKRLG